MQFISSQKFPTQKQIKVIHNSLVFTVVVLYPVQFIEVIFNDEY